MSRALPSCILSIPWKRSLLMPHSVTRSDAFDAIVGERVYQDQRWASSPSMGHHETGAYLSFLQSYITRAIDEITQNETDEQALDSGRKIAALAVACMEDNGVIF